MTADPVPQPRPDDVAPPVPPDVLRLSTPAGLLAAVPGLLGFTPTDSLVVLALAGRRVEVTLRLDLPRVADDVSALVRGVVPRLQRAAPRADQVVLVVYPAEPAGHRLLLPWRALVDDLARTLGECGIGLRDALCVSQSEGRWFSYLCDDDTCCPPTGEPLEGGDSLRARSGLALAGVAPLPDRAALVAEVAPTFEPVRRTVADLLDEASAALADRLCLASTGESGDEGAALVGSLEAWRDEAIEEIERLLRCETLDEVDAARVLLGLADVRVRDTLLWELMADDSREVWQRAAEALAVVVRRAPAGAVAPAATVLAVTRWQHGDGVRAVIALDRALADEPDYSLALLVMQALDAGLPPEQWRTVMGSLDRDECRYGASSSRSRRSSRRRRRGR